jgi:hypothetical protein
MTLIASLLGTAKNSGKTVGRLAVFSNALAPAAEDFGGIGAVVR